MKLVSLHLVNLLLLLFLVSTVEAKITSKVQELIEEMKGLGEVHNNGTHFVQ